MSLQRGAVLLLIAGLSGCVGVVQSARVPAGAGGSATITPRNTGSVWVPSGDFQQAVQALAPDVSLAESPRAAAYRLMGAERPYAHVRARLGVFSLDQATRTVPGTTTGMELARDYGRWCERMSRGGDCLHLLESGATLDEDGKRTLALSIAMDSVFDETRDALRGMADPVAIQAAIITSMTAYLGLWLLPEPISKGVATTLTVALIAYLGVDTVWGLISGWMRLADEVRGADSFAEVQTAGERYGKVMGGNAARAFVMLATAAIGSTAGLVMKLPGLPGAAQATQLAAEGGLNLSAIANVEAVVAPAAGTITVAMATSAVVVTQPQDPGEAGEYSRVGGHHVHAKSAFRDDINYDPGKGFSISQQFMKSRGWSHQAMTAKQRALFDELAASGRPNTLAEHTRIAEEALVAGGASRAEAQQLVQESIANLTRQGVHAPTGIPWNR